MTRRGIIALAVVAVLTVLGGVAALIIGMLGGSPVGPHSNRYISCAYTGADDGYCDRFAEDVVRRTELTDEQRNRLEADARKAQQAVQLASPCVEESTQGVVTRIHGCSGQSADEAIRLALDRAGYPGAVVRKSRADDPAPHDTIVFGVPIADACLVGWTVWPAGNGGYGLQGRLPGDGCLSA
ncbi:hypothetical protein [Dactylosporangium sp. NPDC051541]|uniref:hypothetical protein n=1 Tax=Dactylosporangium sp. NPDC051541 TaxID=3363977 RepID=UPI0037BA54DD